MAAEVFSGKLIRVRVDERGHELVEHPPAAVVAAVGEDGRVWLIRSRRPVPEISLVELPAGLVDPGESAEGTARRELREECGLEAESWEPLASAYSSPGFSDERIHVFLARGLREVGGEDPDGAVEEVFQATVEEALRLCFLNLQSLAALLLAQRRLETEEAGSHRG
jgi:ADP-ribose pyrophosphatase